MVRARGDAGRGGDDSAHRRAPPFLDRAERVLQTDGPRLQRGRVAHAHALALFLVIGGVVWLGLRVFGSFCVCAVATPTPAAHLPSPAAVPAAGRRRRPCLCARAAEHALAATGARSARQRDAGVDIAHRTAVLRPQQQHGQWAQARPSEAWQQGRGKRDGENMFACFAAGGAVANVRGERQGLSLRSSRFLALLVLALICHSSFFLLNLLASFDLYFHPSIHPRYPSTSIHLSPFLVPFMWL